jgi:hypothetical protein
MLSKLPDDCRAFIANTVLGDKIANIFLKKIHFARVLEQVTVNSSYRSVAQDLMKVIIKDTQNLALHQMEFNLRSIRQILDLLRRRGYDAMLYMQKEPHNFTMKDIYGTFTDNFRVVMRKSFENSYPLAGKKESSHQESHANAGLEASKLSRSKYHLVRLNLTLEQHLDYRKAES